jgi:hypothetical protein
MKLLDLKPGSIVNVNCGSIHGRARVMGFSAIAQVPVGRGIIISTEELEGIDKNEYPYEAMAIFETFLTIEE